ncbi:codanin-1-like [Mercenaria mercenaria]|uniref:codanin-1-like n=1 Tax=Mercenaria mercenaria TaxID=6596 RepID=UPI00234EF4BA|nr:codanin-1-like [Mercenaria mercenaria]
MASILELMLQEKVSPEKVVTWLCNKSNTADLECLQDLENLKLEFIPFFLNYLRDHTIHLLQTSKSATPSPAKTPSLKKIQKSVKKTKENGGKRQQLFGASPAGDVDELRNLPASVFSPNTSLDSPGNVQINQKGDRSYGKGNFRSNYASQKFSPQCGSQRYTGQKCSPQCGSQRSPYSQVTPEQRSKQKFSLGEFMNTPDQSNNANGWKRKSPHSSSKKDFTFEISPSPSLNQGRKSGGKKRHSYSPLVQNVTPNFKEENKSAPVFSLTNANDFPPMGNTTSENQGKKNNNRRSLDSSIQTCQSSDAKISRVINFSNSESSTLTTFQRDRLQEVKRLSPVTVQTSTPGPRRITPTVVKADNSVPQNSAFLVPIEENESVWKSNSGSASDKQTVNETVHLSKGERELLKEEKARCHSQLPETGPVSLPTPTKQALERGSSVSEIVEACLADITHQDKLDILIALYSKCLDDNLLPNVIVELYFLVQLLTSRGGGVEETFIYGDDVIEENYFSSVHNTVYFAISVLEQQKRLVRMLDRCTLYLLAENQRVATFSAELQKFLEECYERAELQRGPAFPHSPIGTVSFQADTDNRKNFPNDKCFHLFKRQRDGFYELIREWEASRMNPNYNMAEMFGGRVRALVNVRTDLANLIHFARLFQSQLIAMCKGDGSIRSSDDDENIALLSQLKRTNPEKFKRLQERFIKPLSFGGPCPNPSFPGIQEFFRDFIVVACCPMLNQHLCDTFSAKVLELNETTFTNHDEEDAPTSNGDDEEKEMFVTVLLSVRLVGKFLGFVTFLPYRSPDRMPDSMETTYITIRNKHQPSIDLLECLISAITRGTLCLTIPWVVECLSMMDPLAPRLDHYQTVLYLLLYIHRYVWSQLQDEMCYGNLMVVAMMSWLLENPVIPDGLFFMEIPENILQKIQDHFPSLASLDNRNFVDQTLFYKCCPYVGELKTLLVDFAVGSSSKVTNVRKITPISADIPVQKSLTDRQLQLQMEENFFHNHPASMKRVIDFVADRTASNFIKNFRATLLQESLVDGKERVIKQMHSLPEGSPTSKMKDRVLQVTNRVAQELYTKVRTSVLTEAPKYCLNRIPVLLTMLLPDDQSKVVLEMASKISERIAEEKVINWLNKHISTAMYQTEIMPDLEKLTKSMSSSNLKDIPSPGNKSVTQSAENKTRTQSGETGHMTDSLLPVTHDETLKHPSEILIEFKDCIKNMTLRGWSLPDEKISNILGEVKQTMEHRQDILPSVHRSFTQLTVELVISLLIHQPTSYTRTLIDTCIKLWKSCLNDVATLNLVFSGRIVFMIQTVEKPQFIWEEYTKLLLLLFREDIIKPSLIQETGLKFIPNVQNEELLLGLCHCLCSLVKEVPEFERAETLGACLEVLYNRLPGEKSKEATMILEVLGVSDHVKDLENDMNQLNI